jgi:uncharacterized protein (DUF433 family)
LNLRDVGVAGSNPVTPTIDFIRVFSPPPPYGSRSPRLTVPKTVPVSVQENRSTIRLFLDARGRPVVKGPLQRIVGHQICHHFSSVGDAFASIPARGYSVFCAAQLRAANMTWNDRITFDPAVMSGKPCIRGMRVTVGTVVGLVAEGRSEAEILAAYPYLEAADIRAALAYAAWRSEERDVPLTSA